jgi:hypothetical protein
LGYHQGQFERVNRVKAKTFPEERLLRLNLRGIDLQMERLYEESCDFGFQW